MYVVPVYTFFEINMKTNAIWEQSDLIQPASESRGARQHVTNEINRLHGSRTKSIGCAFIDEFFDSSLMKYMQSLELLTRIPMAFERLVTNKFSLCRAHELLFVLHSQMQISRPSITLNWNLGRCSELFHYLTRSIMLLQNSFTCHVHGVQSGFKKTT